MSLSLSVYMHKYVYVFICVHHGQFAGSKFPLTFKIKYILS